MFSLSPAILYDGFPFTTETCLDVDSAAIPGQVETGGTKMDLLESFSIAEIFSDAFDKADVEEEEADKTEEEEAEDMEEEAEE